MLGYKKWKFKAPLSSGHIVAHDVYSKGDGPIVVIIQELPGICPETLSLADMFVAKGFNVVLPHLFGPLGKIALGRNTARILCMRREFVLFSGNRTSPIVDWLRALCKHLKDENGVKGVGTIGMCVTGNFAISLMVDDAVLAGVASQPSLPVVGHSHLPMSPRDVFCIREKLQEKGAMKAYRFEGDGLCSHTHYQAIEKAFNNERELIELNTLPGKGHAVLTHDFVDEEGHPTKKALDDILTYFQRQLSA